MRPATTVAVDGTSRSGSPTGEIVIVCRQQVLVVASYTRTWPAPESRSITGDPMPVQACPAGDACRDPRLWSPRDLRSRRGHRRSVLGLARSLHPGRLGPLVCVGACVECVEHGQARTVEGPNGVVDGIGRVPLGPVGFLRRGPRGRIDATAVSGSVRSLWREGLAVGRGMGSIAVPRWRRLGVVRRVYQVPMVSGLLHCGSGLAAAHTGV
jgi:hypothetical protein